VVKTLIEKNSQSPESKGFITKFWQFTPRLGTNAITRGTNFGILISRLSRCLRQNGVACEIRWRTGILPSAIRWTDG